MTGSPNSSVRAANCRATCSRRFSTSWSWVSPGAAAPVRADSLCYQVERSVTEHKDKLDEATKTWSYTEPDWDELRSVVTGHGPKSQERLEFRRLNREETRWVRDTVLAPRAAAA